jgi:hypothetical protein
MLSIVDAIDGRSALRAVVLRPILGHLAHHSEGGLRHSHEQG